MWKLEEQAGEPQCGVLTRQHKALGVQPLPTPAPADTQALLSEPQPRRRNPPALPLAQSRHRPSHMEPGAGQPSRHPPPPHSAASTFCHSLFE
ncbi:hypothetical protein AAFF_G00062590 [Aldrovandia affinis]|uniref:Uncharacterized protein n=1 Tax=Aldrovandia affinis TaxID=143900 RepID=A0AAD7RZP8_9TELE|nr:hypothetical protein AAFF_G00062590 [Aldrovandia affinis]